MADLAPVFGLLKNLHSIPTTTSSTAVITVYLMDSESFIRNCKIIIIIIIIVSCHHSPPTS